MARIWYEGGSKFASGRMSKLFVRVWEADDEQPKWRAGDFVIQRAVYEFGWEVVNAKTNKLVARAFGRGGEPPRREHV